MPSKKIIWFFLLLFIVSSGIALYFFDRTKDDWLLNYWGVIGSNASLLGIVYTILQLKIIRSEAEIIKKTAFETKSRINEFNGFGEIAKAIKLIQEVQGCARLRNYEVGVIRLQELKIIVTQLKFVNMEAINVPDMTSTIFELNQLINGMEKEISLKTNKLQTVLVNKSLEKISDILVEFQAKIIQRN